MSAKLGIINRLGRLAILSSSSSISNKKKPTDFFVTSEYMLQSLNTDNSLNNLIKIKERIPSKSTTNGELASTSAKICSTYLKLEGE